MLHHHDDLLHIVLVDVVPCTGGAGRVLAAPESECIIMMKSERPRTSAREVADHDFAQHGLRVAEGEVVVLREQPEHEQLLAGRGRSTGGAGEPQERRRRAPVAMVRAEPSCANIF